MTPSYRGFETYNKFKKSIRDIKQLYDLTYHLYLTERERLEEQLPKDKSKIITVKTSVGEIAHSLTSLYQRLKNSYPYKLRQLLLINSITSLEVYLTDVVYEIFKRDIVPFKEDKPVQLQKNYLLNLNSLNELQDKLIRKDIRNLTSGGLQVIEKYFKKLFEIDFKNLGISFNEIVEIHTRRHLFVHRNGIADSEYCSKFPDTGAEEGKIIKIEHEYFIAAIDKLSEFAGLINKKLLQLFPDEIRKPIYSPGKSNFNFEKTNLMVEVGLNNESFDFKNYLDTLTVRGLAISDYIVQITQMEKSFFLFISGDKEDIMRFFKPMKEVSDITIIRIIEMKNNAS